ncbi:ArsR/SmtB family transcription factor [Streptomyces sp. SD15]
MRQNYHAYTIVTPGSSTRGARRIVTGNRTNELADPMRMRVVRALAEDGGELSCSDIELPVTKSTRTRHYRALRESGVLRQVYRGTAKMNRLRREDLDARFPGLLDTVLAAAANSPEL